MASGPGDASAGTPSRLAISAPRSSERPKLGHNRPLIPSNSWSERNVIQIEARLELGTRITTMTASLRLRPHMTRPGWAGAVGNKASCVYCL